MILLGGVFLNFYYNLYVRDNTATQFNREKIVLSFSVGFSHALFTVFSLCCKKDLN